MRPGIRFDGMGEMDRRLARMAKVATPEVQERALLAGAHEFVIEAKALVPVLTGNLRESIVASTTAGGMNSAAGKSGGGGVVVYVGPAQGSDAPHDGFYGHMVELGTSDTAAQPFISPAFDGPARHRATRAIGQVLSAEIKKQGS